MKHEEITGTALVKLQLVETDIETLGLPMPDRRALASVIGMTLEQRREVIKLYRTANAGIPVANASMSFSHICSKVAAEACAEKKREPAGKVKMESNPVQDVPLVNKKTKRLTSQVALDDLALHALKFLPSNKANIVLDIMLEKPHSLDNPSAYLMSLLKKPGPGQLEAARVSPPNQARIARHEPMKLDRHAVAGTGHSGTGADAKHPGRQARLRAEAVDTPRGPPAKGRLDDDLLVAADMHQQALAAPFRQPITPCSLVDGGNIVFMPTVTRNSALRLDTSTQQRLQDMARLLAGKSFFVQVVACNESALQRHLAVTTLSVPISNMAHADRDPQQHTLLALFNLDAQTLHGLWIAAPSVAETSAFNTSPDQMAFLQLLLQGQLPQSACFCLLGYDDNGFILPQKLSCEASKALLRTLLMT